MMTGHKGAILDLHWSRDARTLFSASADFHLASWDTETGQRIRKHAGHEEVINSMDVSKRGEEVLVSASDDGYIGVCSSSTNEKHRNADQDCFSSGILVKSSPSTSSKRSFLSQQSRSQKQATSYTVVVSTTKSRSGMCERKQSYTL